MAKLVIFEDDPQFQETLRRELSDHQIVAEASTVSGAFDVLGRLAAKDLETDFVLLDGQLAPDDNDPIFRRSDYLPPLPVPQKRKFRRAPQVPKNEFSPNDYYGRYQDAEVIIKVMEACGIEVPIISISNAKLGEHIGLSVAADVTKDQFSTLPRVIEALS